MFSTLIHLPVRPLNDFAANFHREIKPGPDHQTRPETLNHSKSNSDVIIVKLRCTSANLNRF